MNVQTSPPAQVMPTSAMPALAAHNLRKTFRRETGEVVRALDGVDFVVAHGSLAALVGPDGAGKTTFLRLATGLMTADDGELAVLGIDVARDPQDVQNRIGYMPQRFGLYEDLTVDENLNLYADLHGVTAAQRQERYPRLMAMTDLGRFRDRLAGRLSGGMKQKLGLACALVRSPELLLLDEPTVGVDPLSRRELWEIIQSLVAESGLTVVVSTSYLDEAERCGHVLVLHEGRVLATGPPDDVSQLASGRSYVATPPPGRKARTLQSRLLGDAAIADAVPEGGRVRFVRFDKAADGLPVHADFTTATAVAVPPRFEDGFMLQLRRQDRSSPTTTASASSATPTERHGGEVVVEVVDLVRRFGTFTAVDHVSFEARRGEIFGLLGPNGAGKTTTFRMLCGLLPATSGTLRVAGVDLRTAQASARQRLGYVAQKFSLYGQLSVVENLEFFARAYGLKGRHRRERVAWALNQFELKSLARLASGQLPEGFKRRLSMAAALMHAPEVVFLDEPTSGADPLARREFWQRITGLSDSGVTIVVTTHFMEEAEYCDRIVILDAGRVVAEGTPAEVRRRARRGDEREATMEDAFVAVVEDVRRAAAGGSTGGTL